MMTRASRSIQPTSPAFILRREERHREGPPFALLARAGHFEPGGGR